MSNIKTTHIYPPIPTRQYDWEAVREDYEEGDLIGYGKTEQEAIDDLLEMEGNKHINTMEELTQEDVNEIIECLEDYKSFKIEGNLTCRVDELIDKLRTK